MHDHCSFELPVHFVLPPCPLVKSPVVCCDAQTYESVSGSSCCHLTSQTKCHFFRLGVRYIMGLKPMALLVGNYRYRQVTDTYSLTTDAITGYRFI